MEISHRLKFLLFYLHLYVVVNFLFKQTAQLKLDVLLQLLAWSHRVIFTLDHLRSQIHVRVWQYQCEETTSF